MTPGLCYDLGVCLYFSTHIMSNQPPALHRVASDREKQMILSVLQNNSCEMDWERFCDRWVPVLYGVSRWRSPVPTYNKACQKLLKYVFPEITNPRSTAHWKDDMPKKNAMRLYVLDLQFQLCFEETRNEAFQSLINRQAAA